ncbi:MAG: FIST C-terminal domain-containing protein [Myxococcales bacterium]|nr:FIST C-terminal domain-containing protein [Myxococcales bacterium]
MKSASAWSIQSSAGDAVREALQQVKEKLGQSPSFVIVHLPVRYETAEVAAFLHAEGIPAVGGTSLSGVLTESGYHAEALGMMGIYDPEGAYGTALAPKGDDPRAAGRLAAERAAEAADRPGESPDIVLLAVSPGGEEEVIAGIESLVGSHCPIMGGSTADQDVSGQWRQLGGGQAHGDAVAVAFLYPSGKVATAFHSGYEPTERRGIATKAEGRIIHEIDHRPAREVYGEWSGVLPGEGGPLVESTTLFPIGRQVGEIGGIPYFGLSHPVQTMPDGGMEVYTDIAQGDELVLMQGTRDSIATRAGRVLRSALESGEMSKEEVSCVFFVFCAGCMMTVQDRLEHVSASVKEVSEETPCLMTFTYGEQGCLLGGENWHGNLMISALVIGA